MTEALTEKQKANRAYYAANAERIKAQKRASGKQPKPKTPPAPKPQAKPVKEAIMTIKRQWQEEKKPDVWHTSDEDKRQVALRRKIEDWHLARELGLDGF